MEKRPQAFKCESLSDGSAIEHWIAPIRYRSSNTARSYETEITRFRIFLTCLYPNNSINTLIKNATELDILLYECALGDQIAPDGKKMNLLIPPHVLIFFGRKSQPFLIKKQIEIGTNQKEKASLGVSTRLLKESSANQSMRILHGFYSFLSRPSTLWENPYVVANPVSRVKKSKTRAIEKTQRFIPIEGIQALKAYIEKQEINLTSLPLGNTQRNQLLKIQRMRWLFSLLFGLWARRSEISNLYMRDFVHDYSGWFVNLRRKGGGVDRIPVPKWLIDELTNYRVGLGLVATPSADESHPAVMRLTNHKGISAQSIYLEVKEMAAETARAISNGQLLNNLNEDHKNKYIQDLYKFSPHWFRHSAASMAINSNAMSLQVASVRLAHKSTNTTSQMYFHADQEQERAGIESMGITMFGACPP